MTHRSTGRSDVEWCYDVVTDVSRTFAITVADLEEPMARDVCVGYLVCRVADTVEDDRRIPPAEKARLLRTYDAAVESGERPHAERFLESVEGWIPDDPGPDWRLVAESPRVLSVFGTLDPGSRRRIRAPVREMIGGMAEFVERHADTGGLRIRTLEELEEYCWYVAGTVGTLVTNLVAEGADPETSEGLHANARDFALLLQLVNVAKDVGSDYREENNVYLPASWLGDAGLVPEDVGDPASAPEVGTVIRRLTDHVQTHLDGAEAWLEAVPQDRGNTLSAWAVPFLLAVGTLRELERSPAEALLDGDVKVSRAEVRAVRARFEDGATAGDLGRLRRMVRERPLQEW